MTIDMVPYPEYKESGLPWLGKVPVHWNLRKLRSILKEITERNQPDLPLLSVVREKGVIVRDVTSKDENHNFIPDDLTNYKVVRKGQFAMNKMKAWQGSYGVSLYDGIVSPAYFVFEINEVGGNFFHAAIRSRAYVPFFTQASDGVRIGQWDLSKPRMREIPFAVPPSPEQDAIVSFLRGFDAKVRRFVRNRRWLIEVLNEQKQAIINRAVTRGLDPNVHLKPSGIDWVNEIPEHWEVRRLKFLSRSVNEQTSAKQPDEVYIALEHVESWTGRITLPDDDVSFDSQVKRFQPNDVLFGKLRPYLAKVTRPQNAGVCVGEFLVLRVTANEVFAGFLEHKLRSKRVIDLINGSTFGAKMPRADWTFIGNVKFAYPPVSEQHAIIAHIHEKSAKIDQAISRAQREVDLIREYRTRLITDVVTGKLDVCHLSPDIGDELAEPEDMDEYIDDEELLGDEEPELDEEAGA